MSHFIFNILKGGALCANFLNILKGVALCAKKVKTRIYATPAVKGLTPHFIHNTSDLIGR